MTEPVPRPVLHDDPAAGRTAAGEPGASDPRTIDAAGLCALIADAAEAHALPPAFLARLIWQESRFDIHALSPAGAQGVAQFMPGTARLRGLEDPWDPHQAIPAAAHYLAEMRARFGNLGLAAAAYNAGPRRVAGWLARGGRLPTETIGYVFAITGLPPVWFRASSNELESRPLKEGMGFREACAALPVAGTQVANRPPWGVQIAAGISPAAALRAFLGVRSGLSSIIGGREPVIIRSRLVAGRTAYSARVGAESRAEALGLCRRLRAAGAPCVVRRN